MQASAYNLHGLLKGQWPCRDSSHGRLGIDVQNKVCRSIAWSGWLERRMDEMGWTHPAREGFTLCCSPGWQCGP